nr:AAA family ATPase [Chloroflexota bacterium]
AALELVDGVSAVGPGIRARAGVLTGEAAVSLGATNQGMVAGDLVNTAARLQGAAQPGTVLVGESTQRATARAIAYEPAGEQALKGKAAPVPAFRALRVVAEVGGKNRTETLEAPFVGRDDELRLLKELFHATGRERRARLVSISAPAGLGKSRLAWELSKYLDGVVEPVWWHAGRSPAYGQGITFWALGEMVRERAGLAETDDEATTRERIRATMTEWISDPDEARWIEPALLALLGVESVAGGPESLFGAWRTFFERISAQGTVVLIFEDLHWADPGTLDFIDHLLEWGRAVPLFIVTLARPELFEKRPDWTSGRRNFISIALERLTDPAMAALLEGLVPGLPEPTIRRIVGRADGVPLYAVETVRMLVAEGKLVRSGDDGAYRPNGDLNELAVPETLTALIAARLDALEPAERALVADAAVLGQSFTTAGLLAVTGIIERELEPRLRVLVRREILVQALDPRSPDRGQYAFVQALIREVAYNTLARRERRARHLAAARYFESLDTDELAGALAGHYLAAFAMSTPGPEADAVGGQARIALRAAAERAGGLGGHAQAVAFLDQALTVTTNPGDEAELREQAGQSATNTGDFARAEAFLRRAVELRRELGDRSGTTRVTAKLGSTLLLGFRYDAAVELLERAVAEFPDPAADPAAAQLGAQLARAMSLTSKPRRATEISEWVLAAAEEGEMNAILADTLVTKGASLADLGRSYEGIGVMQIGLGIARSFDLPATVLRALTNIVVTQIARDPAAAVAATREGLVEARRLGLRPWITALVGNGAEGALATGDWDWALAEVTDVLASDIENVDRGLLLTAVTSIQSWRGEAVGPALEELVRSIGDMTDPDTMSVIAAARSQVALAGDRLDEAHAMALERGRLSPLNAPGAYPLAARASLWRGDLEGARTDLAALDATRAHGPAITLHKGTIRAGIAALSGEADEALAGYREVLKGWRDAGLPVLEALTAIDMATMLDPTLPDVQAAGLTARQILGDLGARPFLERLESALSRYPALPIERPVEEVRRVTANEAS